jgi:hypothetical protein
LAAPVWAPTLVAPATVKPAAIKPATLAVATARTLSAAATTVAAPSAPGRVRDRNVLRVEQIAALERWLQGILLARVTTGAGHEQNVKPRRI